MTGAATIAESLKRCQVFTDLNDRQIKRIQALSTEIEPDVGVIIFKQGAAADALYVVESGRVALELSVPSPEGVPSRPATVATAGPGEAFGWSAVVPPFGMTLSARAMDGEPCKLVCIAGPELRDLIERDQKLGYKVMAGMARLLAHRLMQTKEVLLYERGWADVA